MQRSDLEPTLLTSSSNSSSLSSLVSNSSTTSTPLIAPAPPSIKMHEGPSRAPLLEQTKGFVGKGQDSPSLPITHENREVLILGGPSKTNKIADRYIINLKGFLPEERNRYQQTLKNLNTYLSDRFKTKAVRSLTIDSFITDLNTKDNKSTKAITSLPLILWAAFYEQAKIMLEQGRLNRAEEEKEGEVEHPKIFYFVVTPHHCQTYARYLEDPKQTFDHDQKFVPQPSFNQQHLSLSSSAPLNLQTSSLSSSSISSACNSQLPLLSSSAPMTATSSQFQEKKSEAKIEKAEHNHTPPLLSSSSSSVTVSNHSNPLTLPPHISATPSPLRINAVLTEKDREPMRPPLYSQVSHFIQKGLDSPILPYKARANACSVGGPSVTNKIADLYLIVLNDFPEWKTYIKTLRNLNTYLQEKFRTKSNNAKNVLKHKERTSSFKIETFIQALNTLPSSKIGILPPILWAAYYKQTEILFEQARLNLLEEEKEGEVIHPKIFYFVATPDHCHTYVRYLENPDQDFNPDQKLAPSPSINQVHLSLSSSASLNPQTSSLSSLSSKNSTAVTTPTNSELNEKYLRLADFGTVALLEVMAKRHSSLDTRNFLLLLTQKQILQDGVAQPILKQIGNSDSYFYNFKWVIPDLNPTKMICLRVSNLDYLSHPMIAFFDIKTGAMLAEATVYLNKANQIAISAHPTNKTLNQWHFGWNNDDLKKLIEYCLGFLAPGPCHFSLPDGQIPIIYTTSQFQEKKSEAKIKKAKRNDTLPLLSSASSVTVSNNSNPLPLLSRRSVTSNNFLVSPDLLEANSKRYYGLTGKSLLIMFATDKNQILPNTKTGSIFMQNVSERTYICFLRWQLLNLNLSKLIKLQLSNLFSSSATISFFDLQENEVPVLLATVNVSDNKENEVVISNNVWPTDDIEKLIKEYLRFLAPAPCNAPLRDDQVTVSSNSDTSKAPSLSAQTSIPLSSNSSSIFNAAPLLPASSPVTVSNNSSVNVLAPDPSDFLLPDSSISVSENSAQVQPEKDANSESNQDYLPPTPINDFPLDSAFSSEPSPRSSPLSIDTSTPFSSFPCLESIYNNTLPLLFNLPPATTNSDSDPLNSHFSEKNNSPLKENDLLMLENPTPSNSEEVKKQTAGHKRKHNH